MKRARLALLQDLVRLAGRASAGVWALVIAVTCIIPNPANALTGSVVSPVIAASNADSNAGPPQRVSECEVEDGDCTPEPTDEEDSDDNSSSGPLPEVPDDVEEHDELGSRLAPGDLVRVFALGEARPAFESKLPRPSGRA